MLALERIARLATRAAQRSTLPQWRVGAVIVQGNRVLSVGVNKLKTHPRSPTRWSIHAEMDAVLGAPRVALRGATVGVVRLTQGGLYAMSYPCAACLGVLLEAQIGRVIFSGRDRDLHVQEWYSLPRRASALRGRNRDAVFHQ